MCLPTNPVMLVSYAAMVLCMACTAYGSPSPAGSGSSDLLRAAAAAAASTSGDSSMEGGSRGQREISQSTFQHLLAVRSPKYNFGLGKRRYVIENAPGAKRLPQYNFGLGKRGRMDLFDYEEDASIPDSWKDDYQALLSNDIEEYDQDQDKSSEKRASGRYHFGLGKRRNYDFGLGKRSYQQQGEKRLPNRYNFGLGRR